MTRRYASLAFAFVLIAQIASAQSLVATVDLDEYLNGLISKPYTISPGNVDDDAADEWIVVSQPTDEITRIHVIDVGQRGLCVSWGWFPKPAEGEAFSQHSLVQQGGRWMVQALDVIGTSYQMRLFSLNSFSPMMWTCR